ncbi:MAG TPA: UbiX family flavin prenyltransferase [Candidatus Angelobacter sp.]|nr:UbiX family flavin prenyltransferase [Candidatus Angelobacter sp.]
MSVASQPNHALTIAATGASGVVFTRALLQMAERDKRIKTVNFIASDNSLRVFAEELGIKGRSNFVEKLIGAKSHKVQQQNNDDIGANVASGSYPTQAMIILPCSMGTLAGIGQGLARNLIERAADVCLKEKRPLVLCVRESPLNRIHIRNMGWAADAGASIYPLIPTFYNHPNTIDEMARQFACRVLGFIGFDQQDAYVWSVNPPRRPSGTKNR